MVDPVLKIAGSDAALEAARGTGGAVGFARAALASFAKLVAGKWVATAVSTENPFPVAIVSGGGGGGGGTGVDRELSISTWRVKTAFTGSSVGDTITAVRILDVSGSTPAQVGATLWRNETTATDLVAAPTIANLELVGSTALTLAQLQTAGLATQATLASVLAKIIAAPATEAKQDAVLTALAATLKSYSPGGLLTVVASLVRPADTSAYASGDLIANTTAFGTVVPLELVGAARAAGEAIRIERVRLRKTSPLLTNAAFRVHLFRVLPVPSVGDNGVFDPGTGVMAISDIAGYVGTVDVTMDRAAAAGARGVGVPATGSGITCEAAGTVGHETSLYALLEARAGYVPTSGETFTLTIEGARS